MLTINIYDAHYYLTLLPYIPTPFVIERREEEERSSVHFVLLFLRFPPIGDRDDGKMGLDSFGNDRSEE